MLSYLSRRSLVTLNLDLRKLSGEMRAAAPDYFLNVPALLERMRKAWMSRFGRRAESFFQYIREQSRVDTKQEGKKQAMDGLWLGLANALVFLQFAKDDWAEIAWVSAARPLNIETQHYFSMLGIPVLQVYGLTETTEFIAMDDPRQVVPGRVGPPLMGWK
jgi:long-chain acyl-CoA synthetase